MVTGGTPRLPGARLQRPEGPPGTAWCWSCKTFLPVESFTVDRSRKDGRRRTCKACARAYDQEVNWGARLAVFAHYGPACACCGESEDAFLTIHHVGGGGEQHRQRIRKFGHHFYRWLIRNGYPDGYEALCWNCHFAISFRGGCPHQG